MRVAYILSMKGGMAAWNFREIDILMRHGVKISGYATKWQQGPYMPKPEWGFIGARPAEVLLAQPLAFLRSPLCYIRLLCLALKMHSVLEFLMAAHFSLDMRKKRVSHIHCHFGDRKLFTGYYCSHFLHLPLSVTVHAYEILANPNPAMFKLAADACRTVVVQSEFNKREVVRVHGVDERKIRVIRAHGDVADERRRQSTKILIVAGFSEKKGHEVLFEAIKRLGRDDVTVWIAGTGKLDVRKLAEEAGVSHLAVFLGALKGDLLDILYDACDMVVLPSRTAPDGDREGIPAALMEAMSHHKPVISTLHAGIPELVPEVLVPENDASALADAIAYLAGNRDVRERMGERNHRIIKEGYSDQAVLALEREFEGSDTE